jgi:hypothetical protein
VTNFALGHKGEPKVIIEKKRENKIHFVTRLYSNLLKGLSYEVSIKLTNYLHDVPKESVQFCNLFRK